VVVAAGTDVIATVARGGGVTTNFFSSFTGR
jgi:hypothetical protein